MNNGLTAASATVPTGNTGAVNAEVDYKGQINRSGSTRHAQRIQDSGNSPESRDPSGCQLHRHSYENDSVCGRDELASRSKSFETTHFG